MSKKDPFGLISYIVGIVAIVESFISPLAGMILAIVGIVLSKREISDLSRKGRRLNIIALIIGLVILILTLVLTYQAGGFSSFGL